MKVVTEIQMLLLILALLSFHVFAPASQVLADVTLESRRSGYSSDLEDLGAAVFEDGISTDQLEQHHQSRSRNNESQRLQERELTVYDECLVKGRCLFGELAAGISQTTLYTSFTELSTNGWSYTDEYNTVGFSGVGVSDEIIEDLQWRTKDFVYAGYEYPQHWIHSPDGVERIHPRYVMWINTIVGAIVVDHSYAPADPFVNPAIKNLPDLPPLRRWSDATFLVWTNACKNDAACIYKLQYIVHNDVVNYECQWVAKYLVIGRPNVGFVTWDDWPGQSFGTDTDAGKAILGCPNGRGTAYLLLQHRGTFGTKTIESVTIYGNEDGRLNFAFKLST